MRDKSKYGLSAMVPGELQMLLESKDDEIERLQAENEQLRHALDFAWAVIANAGYPSLGAWEGVPYGWQEAAERWRDIDCKAALAIEVQAAREAKLKEADDE